LIRNGSARDIRKCHRIAGSQARMRSRVPTLSVALRVLPLLDSGEGPSDTRTINPRATRNTLIALVGLPHVSVPVSISTSVPEAGDLQFCQRKQPSPTSRNAANHSELHPHFIR
jgi:hypothetical protein